MRTFVSLHLLICVRLVCVVGCAIRVCVSVCLCLCVTSPRMFDSRANDWSAAALMGVWEAIASCAAEPNPPPLPTPADLRASNIKNELYYYLAYSREDKALTVGARTSCPLLCSVLCLLASCCGVHVLLYPILLLLFAGWGRVVHYTSTLAVRALPCGGVLCTRGLVCVVPRLPRSCARVIFSYP